MFRCKAIFFYGQHWLEILFFAVCTNGRVIGNDSFWISLFLDEKTLWFLVMWGFRVAWSLQSDLLEKFTKGNNLVFPILDEAECPLYTGVNLSSLRRLQNLDFSACENITDLAIIHAFKFYDLRSLNLSMCRHVTGRGVEALCRNCPSLENLNLSYTPVDDEGMRELET